MENSKNIIILDTMTSVKFRIKQLMNKNNIKVHDASNSVDLFNILSELKDTIVMIIMDINLKEAGDGFTILSDIRKKNKEIPITILTSSSKRELFLKGIVLGANDYLLKPFEDVMLEKRILKYFENNQNKEDLNLSKEVTFVNLEQYLLMEMTKAKKGKYNVSIFMSTIFRPVKEITKEIEDEYLVLCKDIFDKLKPIFWDTDIFIRYGSQCFIGVFPFCDDNNVKIIEKKLNQKFLEIKNSDKRFQYYNLVNSSNTYPINGDDAKGLIEGLALKMKDAISEFKNL